MKIKEAFKKSLKKIGMDGAVLYTSSSRIIQVTGGVVSVILIAKYLSKEAQGFYYTFYSVLAMQIFFELGLGGIISQFVAHEVAHLRFSSAMTFEGDDRHISRMSSIIHFCLKWYAIFALFFSIALMIFGFQYFSKFGKGYPEVQWKIPWLIVAVSGSLNLFMSPWRAVLQGMNKVKEIARLALIQQIFVLFVTWISLIVGAGLYVVAINSMMNFVVMSILYSCAKYPRLILNIYKRKITQKISYLKEILPLQWKIAISWISGYLIFQLFNPVIFAFVGPIAAGKMGMTLNLLNAILGFVLSWTTTKIPNWSIWIAQKNYSKVDFSCKEVIKQSTIVSLVAISVAITILLFLNTFNISLSERFLPVWLCIVLFLTIPLNNIINAWATCLRCHKKEPFLVQAVLVGLLCAISTFLSAKYLGVEGVVIGYTTIVVLVSFPLSWHIYKTKRQEFCE